MATTSPSALDRIRLGVSACLLGEAVRYDGGHKHNRFLTDVLGRHVEWVPVCPEVELGLGIPRDTLRLVGTPEAPRLVQEKTGEDLTRGCDGTPRSGYASWPRSSWMATSSSTPRLHAASPACRSTATTESPPPMGGLFADTLVTALPGLPVEEEGRLNDPALRENFIERIFAAARWRSFVKTSRPRARATVVTIRRPRRASARSASIRSTRARRSGDGRRSAMPGAAGRRAIARRAKGSSPASSVFGSSPDEAWTRAHDALRAKQKSFGFRTGVPRPAGGKESKYLLSGFAQCGVCGGTIVQTWDGRKAAYRCWYNHTRGRAVCSNSVVVDMQIADDAVLRAITRDVLDPAVVSEVLDVAVHTVEETAAATAARLDGLKAELARIETELARYAEAIAEVGPLDTVVEAMKSRDARRESIRAELKSHLGLRREPVPDAATLRTTVLEYLEEWTGMARERIAEARRLLRAVLVGRLVLTPVVRPPELPPRKGPGRKPRFVYEFSGEASLSSVFAGLISATLMVAPTGTTRLNCIVPLDGVFRVAA